MMMDSETRDSTGTTPPAIPSSATVSAGTAAAASAPAPDADSPEQAPHVRSFEEARAFAHSLGFRHRKQWERWAATAKRPADIPVQPRLAYQDRGWRGWADWLGAEAEGRPAAPTPPEAEAESRGPERAARQRAFAPQEAAGAPPARHRASPPASRRPAGRRFRSFPQARAFARTLGLRRKTDWEAWSASGQRPADIPSEPHVVYRDQGWVSWPDWLGVSATAAAARRTASAAPPAGRGGQAARPEHAIGGGRGAQKQTERATPVRQAGEPGAAAAVAQGAARVAGGAGPRLSQIGSGLGHRLRVVAARAWGEMEEIWADAQRLRQSGPR